jgi:co-chaperonin GroES (HSP10)
MNFPIEPRPGRFIVKRDEPDKVTEAGLENPNPDEKNTGTVIAVGKDGDEPVGVSINDRVIWTYSGSRFTFKGQEYLLMSLFDIVGTIKETE